MKHNYLFPFKRIILKPLEESDIESLRIVRNKERQYFSSQAVIEPEQQTKWYQRYLEKDNDIMFKIVLADDAEEKFVGAIAVYDIDWEQKTAEVGRTVVDKNVCAEKGIGTEATTAVCLFAFDVLKIKKIIGVVLKSNERIIKVDTRAGFVITGDHDSESYAIEMTRESINLG